MHIKRGQTPSRLWWWGFFQMHLSSLGTLNAKKKKLSTKFAKSKYVNG